MELINQFKKQFGEILSRNELKSIVGGKVAPGTRCVLYCCDHSGNCSEGVIMDDVDECVSNEECQSLGSDWTCSPGTYVAGLCKG